MMRKPTTRPTDSPILASADRPVIPLALLPSGGVPVPVPVGPVVEEKEEKDDAVLTSAPLSAVVVVLVEEEAAMTKKSATKWSVVIWGGTSGGCDPERRGKGTQL